HLPTTASGHTAHSNSTRQKRPTKPIQHTPRRSSGATSSADSSTNTTPPPHERDFGTPHRRSHVTRASTLPATPLRFVPPVDLIRFVCPEFERSGTEHER